MSLAWQLSSEIEVQHLEMKVYLAVPYESFFKKLSASFIAEGKDSWGAMWRRGAPGMVFPVALLSSSLRRSAWCQEQVWSSLILGFYVLDPLVLVLLTELVWVVESCTATRPLQKVCVSLRLHFGGDSRMNGLRECMSPYTPKPCLLGNIHKLSCLGFHVVKRGK